jgi:cytidine deaminase
MEKIMEELLQSARDAASLSYSPYSHFRVGAAVLADGSMYQGANIENACSNLGICAERVAIAHARMHGAKSIVGIALYCLDAEKDDRGNISMHHCTPCGACLQWLSELAPDAWLVTNASTEPLMLSDLLPKPFALTLR